MWCRFIEYQLANCAVTEAIFCIYSDMCKWVLLICGYPVKDWLDECQKYQSIIIILRCYKWRSIFQRIIRWCSYLLHLSLSIYIYIFHSLSLSLSLYIYTHNKRKPPCIGGMELAWLSCNRVFISAESVGRGWCKIAIATKWCQFHTTDKCGFPFMPWMTDQYTFVRYTKLVNRIGTAGAKVIMFSIMTT